MGLKPGVYICQGCKQETLKFGEPCYTCSIKALSAHPKVLLGNLELQTIYDEALEDWRSSINKAIDGSLYPLACYLKAFEAHCYRLGIKITIDLPSESQIEPD